MTFSWKKKRCNRFSRLVADHLQSPKRGGSLVVETGFPTSLIDLYVRNRGRFRRSSVRKQKGNDSPAPVSSCSSSPSPSPSRASGLLVDSDNLLVDLNNCSSGGLDHRGADEIIEEDVVVSDGEIVNSTEIEVEKSVEMAKLNPVVVVVLKVLFMVVLMLGTKRFAIGITVSAFVLLLLELMGKRLLGISRSLVSSVDLKSVSESSFQEASKLESLKEDMNHVCSGVLEIEEEVESKQEVRSEKELDEVRSEGSMEIRRKSSRRAIMKSKMKKLVPKKLRKSSMGSKEDVSYEFIEEEESVMSAHDHKTLAMSSGCSDSKGATLCILKQNQDKIVEIEERALSSTLSSEIECNDKELRRGLHQNSGFLVLCLVVLVGLIGGRVLALVLSLSWCLMMKKLHWRNVKFPF